MSSTTVLRVSALVALLALAACADEEGAQATSDTTDTGVMKDGAVGKDQSASDVALDAALPPTDSGSEDVAVVPDQVSPPDTAEQDISGDDTAASDAAVADVPVVTDTSEDVAMDVGADVPTPDVAEDAGPVTAETVTLHGACALPVRLGGFVVEQLELFSIVDGKVTNGVDPVTVANEVLAAGDCKLLKKEYPVCDPLCEPGTTCDYDGSCIPYPEQQDLGTVTIDGLLKAVVMEPQPPGASYYDTDLPQPPFEPGALIRLTSTDGFAGEMEMYGVAPQPLALIDSKWTVKKSEALTIAWTPPEGEVRTTVGMRLNIDQHGNSPVTLVCELPDTGTAEIAADLITELLSYGVSGFPNATLTRHTADSMEIPTGCIDFLVGFPAEPSVTVADHYPCSPVLECPDGMTCNLPIETCE